MIYLFMYVLICTQQQWCNKNKTASINNSNVDVIHRHEYVSRGRKHMYKSSQTKD